MITCTDCRFRRPGQLGPGCRLDQERRDYSVWYSVWSWALQQSRQPGRVTEEHATTSCPLGQRRPAS